MHSTEKTRTISSLRLTAAILVAVPLLAGTTSAQRLSKETIPSLGLEFRLSGDLEAKALDPDSKSPAAPHMRAEYSSKDSVNKYGTSFMKDGNLRVLEFNRDGSIGRARTFEAFVREHKEFKGERTIHTENERTKGKRKAADHKFWEYSDTMDLDGDPLTIYHVAAAYDLGNGREVALIYDIYVFDDNAKATDRGAIRTGQKMVQSVSLGKAAAESSLKGDRRARNAKTPEQMAALEAAVKRIQNLKGWDFATTKEFVILYSFDADASASKKKKALKEAEALADQLAAVWAQFEEDFPYDKGTTKPYPVIRVCHDRDAYKPYIAPNGRVANFIDATNESVVQSSMEGLPPIEKDGLTQRLIMSAWQQFAAKRWPDAPMQHWWNLGTAAYYAQFEKKGRKLARNTLKGSLFEFSVSETSWRLESPIALLKQDLRQDAQVPLRDFVSWDNSKFDGARPANHRAQAYALVDFLARSDEAGYNEIWKKYPAMMAKTKSTKKTIAELFKGVDYGELDKAWRQWIDRKL